MDYIFERHEPASIKKKSFNIIKIYNTKKWEYKKVPDYISHLNRYLIEKDNLIGFINSQITSFNIYSCIYTEIKARFLTKVQRFKKEKSLIKSGWVASRSINGLFVNKLSLLKTSDTEQFEDLYQDSVFVLQNKQCEADILDIVQSINLLDMPENATDFYLTSESLINLIRCKITLVYKITGYYENNANEERDIYVCYSPMKL